jgi:hypothetical protein
LCFRVALFSPLVADSHLAAACTGGSLHACVCFLTMREMLSDGARERGRRKDILAFTHMMICDPLFSYFVGNSVFDVSLHALPTRSSTSTHWQVAARGNPRLAKAASHSHSTLSRPPIDRPSTTPSLSSGGGAAVVRDAIVGSAALDEETKKVAQSPTATSATTTASMSSPRSPSASAAMRGTRPTPSTPVIVKPFQHQVIISTRHAHTRTLTHTCGTRTILALVLICPSS